MAMATESEQGVFSGARQAAEVIRRVNRVILGKEEQVREIMLCFLANGHALIEDMPGVGKTTLATAFAGAMGLDCKRVQFTPDVMPSDLTGFSVFQKETGRFVYQPGSVFCHLLLADELNRTSPKTQSALLEVMEERRVSVEGVTREVPRPFLVIATQNPYGSAGTQRLPESQTDRFTVSLSLGYPDAESETELAMTVEERGRAERITPVLDAAGLLRMQREIYGVTMKESVARYIVALVNATREHPLLAHGASPRATIALVRTAKASAYLEGRNYVTPADVRAQFPYTVRHRLQRSAGAKTGGTPVDEILGDILKKTPRPSLGQRP